jgi:hypothetical protein
MARAPKPLFLGRSSYRRRRLADAARALPVFGAILLILPLLWSDPTQGTGRVGFDLGYLLGLWLALILIAAVLAQGLVEDEVQDGEQGKALGDRADGRTVGWEAPAKDALSRQTPKNDTVEVAPPRAAQPPDEG